MTLIANRLYLFDNRFSSKTLEPITNSAEAGVVIYTRDPNNVANALFRAEAYGLSAPNWWRFKHEASGLYLNSPTGDNDEQLTISAGGNTIFDVSGSDGAGYTMRSLAAPTGYINVGTNSENAAVKIANESGTSNQLFDILAYTPTNVNAPSVSGRLFRHFSAIPVSGVAGGAIVRVLKNGQQIAQVTDTEFDGTLNVSVTGLQAGDVIKTTQEVGGVVSAESAGALVLHHGKVRQVAGNPNKFQAYEMRVSDSTSSNIQDWTGEEGEPIGAVRDSQAQAFQDLLDANFNLTSIPDGSGVVVPPVETMDSIPASARSVFDGFWNSNKGSYNNNVQVLLGKNNEVYRYTSGSKPLSETVGVASLSKWFLGALATKAVQDGAINWTDTLGSKVSIFNTYSKGTPTFKQLMTHTGGWPETSNAWASGNPFENQTGLSLTECADLIAQNVPMSTPGASFVYSGVGMQLAGRMLEVAYSLPIQTIIQNLLWGPCGMVKTSYKQYDFFGDTLNPQLAAGIFTTIDDFGKFMKMLLKRDTVLNSTSTAYMEQDQTGVGAGYGVGVWVNGSSQMPFHQGASGCTAWVDRQKGVWGLIFTYDSTPSSANAKSPEFLSLVRNTL